MTNAKKAVKKISPETQRRMDAVKAIEKHLENTGESQAEFARVHDLNPIQLNRWLNSQEKEKPLRPNRSTTRWIEAIFEKLNKKKK